MKAPVIETDRLTLRGFSGADVGPFVAAVFSNPKVMATLPQDPRTPEEQVDCARHYIETYSTAWPRHGYGAWAVCARDHGIACDGTLLGFCAFELGEREGGIAEIGFGYSQACSGKGVGFEAASAAVDWFFRTGKFEAFHACHDPINVGSKRILDKIGMVYAGDEDLWDSVKQGLGLLPVYELKREHYLRSRSH